MTPAQADELLREAVIDVFKDEDVKPTIQRYIDPIQERYDDGIVRYGIEYLNAQPVGSRYGKKTQAVNYWCECLASDVNPERVQYLVNLLDMRLIQKMSDEFEVVGKGRLVAALPTENAPMYSMSFTILGQYNRG